MSGDNQPTEAVEVVDQAVNTLELRAAFLEARRNIRKVAKDSTAKVTSQRTGGSYTYKFTSSEDMVEACVDALLEHGLTWSLVDWSIGGPLEGYQCPTLWGTFELDHPASGGLRIYRFPMPIASRNDADKALAGAVTYLMGQAIRSVLQIPKSGADDQDPDKRTSEHGGRAWGNDEPRETQRSTPQPQRQQRPPPPQRAPRTPTPEPGKLDGLRSAIRDRFGELRKRDRAMGWDRVCDLAGVENPKAPSPAELAKLNDWIKGRLADLGAPVEEPEPPVGIDPNTDEVVEAEGPARCSVCNHAEGHAEGCPDAEPPPTDEGEAKPAAEPEAKPEAPEPYDPGTPPGIDPDTGEVVDPEAHDAWQRAEERAAIQAEGADDGG